MEKITLLVLLIAISNCAAVHNKTCTSAGKFIADVNCTSYVVCSKIDTQLASYTIQCPAGFIVRHTDMVCSMTGTQCEPSYACTSVGNFTNPSSVNASLYISCIQGIGDMIIATVMECPAPLQFDDASGGCELKTVQNTAQSVPTVHATAPVVAAVATNELAEENTVTAPTIATVPKTAGSRKPNSSTMMVPSYHTILAIVSALSLFYKIK